MKTEEKDSSSKSDLLSSGEGSKIKEPTTSAPQEPQPSTSSSFPNTSESSLHEAESQAKDALFEVSYSFLGCSPWFQFPSCVLANC